MDDDALDSPATHRNREPIREVLAHLLPVDGEVLEIASGSGQHVAHLARAFPRLRWQPSDPDPRCRASIRAWTRELANVREPRALDVLSPSWELPEFDQIVCINMIHIAPWEATPALMAGAASHLRPGGALYLYGPFMRDGVHTAASNARFSADLSRRDPRWGVRDLAAVAEAARLHSLELEEIVEMPANNLSVVFRRRPPHRRPGVGGSPHDISAVPGHAMTREASAK